MRPPPRKENWNGVEKIALGAFLFWSAFGLAFTVLRITPATVAHFGLPASLQQFIDSCISVGDPVLIFLAFVNTHLHAARQWTPAVARKWGAIILVAAFGIESIGTITSLPFGDYHYTDAFGPKLGVVPLTIPLAWHVVVTNALFAVRAVAPDLAGLAEAALTGLICTAYDFILEPFATTVRHYWIWTGGSVPPLNYIAWFVISALMVMLFAPTDSSRFRRDARPWLLLGLTVLIFLAGRTFST